MKSILIGSAGLDAEPAIRACFRDRYRVEAARDLDACVELFRRRRYELLFLDVELIGAATSARGCSAALQPFWQAYPTAQILVMARPEELRKAVMAVKAGASDYLTYPLDTEEIRFVTESLRETARLESELDYLRDRFWQSDSLDVVQTRSRAMQAVFEKIRSVAPTRTTVLLTGETGTGKGVLAKLIHRHSHRYDRQFIGIHCGAIPDTLLESELFGHEKGAFTGAVRRKLGKFEIAHEGSIFLDEIATVTPSAQIKLLKVLQERSFTRVGGEEELEVDVRIIAATNADLKGLSDRGLFRNDLYYRLSVFPVEVPPLRERREDIPLLVQAFLERLDPYHAKGIREVHPLVMESFERYAWPGNIRELENLVERAYILERSSVLSPESIPAEVLASEGASAPVRVDAGLSLAEVRRRGIEEVERRYLKNLLEEHEGRVQRSAEAAGITPRQLHKLMTRHGLRKEDFKRRV